MTSSGGPSRTKDIAHQFEVLEMLRNINRDTGMTIVMVLHDLPQAAAYSDHMIALKRGTVAASGHPHELLTAAFLQQVYNISATVTYVDHYPVIIPNLNRNWRNES